MTETIIEDAGSALSTEEEVVLRSLKNIANELELVKRALPRVIEQYESGRRSLPELLRFFYYIREAHDALDTERKAVNAQIEFISRTIAPQLMDEQQVKTITLTDIKRRFTVNSRVSASMADKDRGLQWLRDNGHEGLIQETVNASTLSAFAKSLVEETGEELPSEIFKLSTLLYTSITKV